MNKKVIFGSIIFLVILIFYDFGNTQGIGLKGKRAPKLNFQKFKFTISDSWFSRDKTHHFLTSAFLSSAGYYFLCEEQNYSNRRARQVGSCLSLSFGVLKEIRDGFKLNNAFSVKDLISDILGTAVGIILVSDL